MRQVIIVPIVHTVVDLGSIAPQVRRLYEKLAGAASWEEHVHAIDSLWDAIEMLVDGLKVDWTTCRLYQDGLPACGKEAQIVHDIADRGGRNHRLLVKLMGQGARLEGTEDAQLLKIEYERIRHLIQQPTASPSSRPHAPDPSITVQRDRFIADRIDATLGDGETGLVFLGMLHRVEDYLPSSITFEFLLPRPRQVDSDSVGDRDAARSHLGSGRSA